MPTSSRPAASLTACVSPPPRGEVPRRADHGGARTGCHSHRGEREPEPTAERALVVTRHAELRQRACGRTARRRATSTTARPWRPVSHAHVALVAPPQPSRRSLRVWRNCRNASLRSWQERIEGEVRARPAEVVALDALAPRVGGRPPRSTTSGTQRSHSLPVQRLGAKLILRTDGERRPLGPPPGPRKRDKDDVSETLRRPGRRFPD